MLLADDHRALAEAIAMRLQAEDDLTVVGITTSGQATEEALRSMDVQVLVVDVKLGDMTGIGVLERAIRAKPTLRAVVLTYYHEPEIALAALRAGASGFLTKDVAIDELVAAIRGVTKEETWVSRRLLTPVLRQLLEGDAGNGRDARIADLTRREREVLECMMAGMSRAAIARTLYLSVNTVRTHAQHVLKKLNAHSAVEAVAIGSRAGLVPYGRSR